MAELALMAWRKGHEYGGTDSMLSFMFIARNRFNAGWGDWLKVIDGMYEDFERQGYPNLADRDYRFILQNVDSVFDGSMPDKLTEGALYWAELPNDEKLFLSEVKPLITNLVPCAKVGEVSIYK